MLFPNPPLINFHIVFSLLNSEIFYIRLVRNYGYLMIVVFFREVKSTKGKVISDKDLEALLDRSDLLGELSCGLYSIHNYCYHEWCWSYLRHNILKSSAFIRMLYHCRAPVPLPVTWSPDETLLLFGLCCIVCNVTSFSFQTRPRGAPNRRLEFSRWSKPKNHRRSAWPKFERRRCDAHMA